MEKSFGEFLSTKRKEKGLTQKELAKELFVTESAVSKWEKDVAHPDITLLPKIADLLGVTEHELITASIDEKTRKTERDARKWRKLSFSWQLFFLLAYGITLFVCFVVDLATGGGLGWFWIVFFSLVLSASFTTLPRYVKKKRAIVLPTAEVVALILLLAVCDGYGSGAWFPLATLPIVASFVTVYLPIWLKVYGKGFWKKYAAFFSVATDYIVWCLCLFVMEKLLCGSWFFSIAFPFLSEGLGVALLFALVGKLTHGFIKAGACSAVSLVAYFAVGYSVLPILFCAGIDVTSSVAFDPFSANFGAWTAETVSNNVNAILAIVLILCTAIFLGVGILKKKVKRKSEKV